IEGDYVPPPSKSFAIRSLIIASLCKNQSLLQGIGESEDVLSALRIISKWRETKKSKDNLFVGRWKCAVPEGRYFVGGSATIARFLLAIFSFLEGERILDGNKNLRKRDLSSSIQAARSLGAELVELKEKGKLPIKIVGKKPKANNFEVYDPLSSQFASGVLIALAFHEKKFIITIKKEVSFPYIKMTEEVLKKFGADIIFRGNQFVIEKSNLKGRDIEIEKDYSSASFFIAGAVATGGKIRVCGLKRNSSQGDKKILKILKDSGVNVVWQEDFLEVEGLPKKGFSANLKNCPDLLPPLVVVALKSPFESIFKGISRLKMKESSRAEVLSKAINKIGGKSEIEGDILKIIPSNSYKGAALDPQNDHRIAMAFAMIGLFAKGTKIINPQCTKKSYPDFWKDFEKLLSKP
ncbi:MAG: 3-phosphoshikimate 1-carboxyvinyltransferase, partial [Acidobacteria bacterium]|nr:3-phosphoshikimate 1-carboxyvinyltransferase [Acidobacteriota bacterium]